MSSFLDLVVRGGLLVTSEGIRKADLGISEGRIVLVQADISQPALAQLSAQGAYVLPGVIDAHVHFNEPGRAHWEGLATGSRALAAGGGTAFFDMPLNSEPPVLNAGRLLEKRALAEKESCVDFGLWGGLVPGNLDKLGDLKEAGAIGLKAFMCASGIDSFPRVDEAALKAGMVQAAKLDMLVAVHAEDEALAAKATAVQRERGATSARAFLDSRPVEVELAAIRTAIELAGETGCTLHVVHVSSPEGVALIAEGKKRGVNVTAETCPHYLLLTDRDVERLGAVAKCAPALRPEALRRGLWECVKAGTISTIGSDHSPAPPEMKTSADFFAIWGGIAGCQHGTELLFSEVAKTAESDLPILAAALARTVARRFRVANRKGALEVGLDADFALLRYGPEREIRSEELLTRHKLSPYIGRRSSARISHTYVRGRPVWTDARLVAPAPQGQFLKPNA